MNDHDGLKYLSVVDVAVALKLATENGGTKYPAVYFYTSDSFKLDGSKRQQGGQRKEITSGLGSHGR